MRDYYQYSRSTYRRLPGFDELRDRERAELADQINIALDAFRAKHPGVLDGFSHKEWVVEDFQPYTKSDPYERWMMKSRYLSAMDDFAAAGSNRDTLFDRLHSKPIEESALMEVLDV